MRRVDRQRRNVTLMDYCTGPSYASGGFIADSAFTGGTMINGSQQQFFVRNSNIDGWSNGVWNQVFAGDTGRPGAELLQTRPEGLRTRRWPPSPETQEEPFLYQDAPGNFKRVRAARAARTPSGTSWQTGTTRGHVDPDQEVLHRHAGRHRARSTWRWRWART